MPVINFNKEKEIFAARLKSGYVDKNHVRLSTYNSLEAAVASGKGEPVEIYKVSCERVGWHKEKKEFIQVPDDEATQSAPLSEDDEDDGNDYDDNDF